MSVRFVHTADPHLGSPLRTAGLASGNLREQLEDATYDAFERIIDVAIDEDVDFVVVSGDLYDQESRSVRANEFAVDQFERLQSEGIPAYVIYGNHDPVETSTEYFELPSNVHEFSHVEAHEITYPPEGRPQARIWGQSYKERSDDRSMYYSYTPTDSSIPNIGLLHTGLNPDGRKYAPCSRADLASKSDIHYWALGHIHQTQVHWESQPIVYPGIPQGRQITEPGVGGCFIVELDVDSEPALEFVPTSPLLWRTVEVSLEAEDGEGPQRLDDVEDVLFERLDSQGVDFEELEEELGVPIRRDEWEPEGFVCRWELQGRTPVTDLLNEEALDRLVDQLRSEGEEKRPFVWTASVRNETRTPLPDRDIVREDDPVLQELDSVVEEALEDPEFRGELRSRAGNLWFEPEDEEDQRETQLQLTDEDLTELIEQAHARATDRLLEAKYS